MSVLKSTGGLGTDAGEAGTVRVAVALPLSAEQAWRALTNPGHVAQWFGELESELRPGVANRLDFGDGDFFTLEQVYLEPPRRARYAWRFLGIGPLDTITWEIEPTASGCLVSVVDREPGRSPEAARALEEGWLDFTRRLERFASTGRSTRYDWRREFDAAIELPVPAARARALLFGAGRPSRWLPLEAGRLEEGARLRIGDGLDPATPEIRALDWESLTLVRFTLGHESWQQSTACELELVAAPAGALLTVHHLGWEAISPDGAEPPRQRRRFSAFWIATLRRARDLVESDAGGDGPATNAPRSRDGER